MIHCLHGAVGSSRSWNFLNTSLLDQIHPLDLWRLFDNSLPTLAEAGQLIADQANQNDILLGYSMGGRLALHALLANPKKWRAAIIISAHPGLIDGHTERLQNDLTWADLAISDWPKFLQKWNKQAILSDTPEGLDLASADEKCAVSKSFQHWSLGKQQDLRSQLHTITCPVLWLTGENDPKFTALATEATALIPSAQHQIIPNSGHRVPWENPDLFLHALENFLAITRKTTILNK